MSATTQPETYSFEDAGIPNSRLPVLVYRHVDGDGMRWDLRRGDPAERDEVLANIAAVPLPDTDPIHGASGTVTRLWSTPER
jgi:uncharacterized protein YjlB